MTLVVRILACSILLISTSVALWYFSRKTSGTDAFRKRTPGPQDLTPLQRALQTPPGKAPSDGDEPIKADPNETELVSYVDRPRMPETACPKPIGRPGDIGGEGHVDWLYTFAAPGTGSPGLKHGTNEDGVFPGLRTWQVTANGWVDLVPLVTALADMWHPWMDGEELAEDYDQPVSHDARLEVTHWPYTIWGKVSLHYQSGYRTALQQHPCEEWRDVWAEWPLTLSYYHVDNLGVAVDFAAARGWNLVGYGYYDGEDGYVGGAQESYLLQKPDTLECVLTFQGTLYFGDWVANLAFTPEHFCGYTEEDEWCVGHGGFCNPRKERGAYVHKGFAENLRNMVRSESWQQGVHAKMGKCSAMYVTGHSLGGTAASLFTACVSQKLQVGDFGYDDDYKYMAWTQAQPERMEAISANATARDHYVEAKV